MDIFLKSLENNNLDLFIDTLDKTEDTQIITTVNLNMNCEWIPFNDKYKCKYCNKIKSQKTKRNCPNHPNKIKLLNSEENQTNIEQNIPSLTRRLNNFGKAVVNHIKGGRRHCTDEERQNRYDICSSNKCGFFVKKKNTGICSHEKCGCFIRRQGKFFDKLSWSDSKCPVGLWSPIIEKNM